MSAYYLNAHILFVFLQFYHIVSALSNPLSFYFLGTSAGIFLCTPRSILPFSSNSSSVLISSLSAMYFLPDIIFNTQMITLFSLLFNYNLSPFSPINRQSSFCYIHMIYFFLYNQLLLYSSPFFSIYNTKKSSCDGKEVRTWK